MVTIAALTESPQHAAVHIGWHSVINNHSIGCEKKKQLFDTHSHASHYNPHDMHGAQKEVPVHKHNNNNNASGPPPNPVTP
jgi:hypothetical protein